MLKTLILFTGLLALTACTSFDKERAEAQRKQELCAKIETQHLSHCAGNHVPPPPVN